MRLLLDRGACIEATTCEQSGSFTALHFAAQGGYQWGYLKVVELLLEKGAEIGRQTSTGKTALELARDGGEEAVVKLPCAHPR